LLKDRWNMILMPNATTMVIITTVIALMITVQITTAMETDQ
jgi:hypothetical protein